eukprot:m.322423 g.322423  ORF g.322423 m.322423 type:complete len:54 (-) comp27606_c0_seq1:1151-1312(-)
MRDRLAGTMRRLRRLCSRIYAAAKSWDRCDESIAFQRHTMLRGWLCVRVGEGG